MDILYFLKEEYATIRTNVPGLVGGDIPLLEGEGLRRFLQQVLLVVRIADDLILPELAERVKRGVEGLAVAGDQTGTLAKITESAIKLGKIGDSRRKEFHGTLVKHLEHMEQYILPLFREEIATQTREDMGVVAHDYKSDIGDKSSTQGGQARVADASSRTRH
jgi:hypothetical protein